jgi:hypothetical protein
MAAGGGSPSTQPTAPVSNGGGSAGQPQSDTIADKFPGIANAPVASEDVASHVQSTLARIGATKGDLKLVRPAAAGGVYAVAGARDLCLIVREGGGLSVGCAPLQLAEDPATPLVATTYAGDQRVEVTALLPEGVSNPTVTTADGTVRAVPLESNVATTDLQEVPRTLVFESGGTRISVNLTDPRSR